MVPHSQPFSSCCKGTSSSDVMSCAMYNIVYYLSATSGEIAQLFTRVKVKILAYHHDKDFYPCVSAVYLAMKEADCVAVYLLFLDY